MTIETITESVLTADEVLANWQGHRRVTRRTIEAFPEDKLFQFSVGGMRPFAELASEFIRMAVPIVDGVSTGKWEEYKGGKPETKAELLRLWDAQTAELNEKFPKIPPHRFSEVDRAFGRWEMPGIATIQYAIDNEFIIAGRVTSTCGRWALSRRRSGCATDPLSRQLLPGVEFAFDTRQAPLLRIRHPPKISS